MDLRASVLEKLREGVKLGRFAAEDEAAIERFITALRSLGSDRLRGKTIALFRALPDELSVDRLEQPLRSMGARLCFPRITDRATCRLEMVEVPTAPAKEERWVKGSYGILEPDPRLPIVDPARLDLLVVPGIAFGMAGERIGRGAGYYDRFLLRATGSLRVGLARDCQIFDQLDQQPWDQKVHWVLSANHDIRTAQAARWLGSVTPPA